MNEIEIRKENLSNTKERVRTILSTYLDSRNSDDILISLFWKTENGSITFQTLSDLSLEDCRRLTSPASIVRARRKIQNEDEEFLPIYKIVLEKRIKGMASEKQERMRKLFNLDGLIKKDYKSTKLNKTQIKKKVEDIYITYPDTKSSYKLLIAKFWASELFKRMFFREITELSLREHSKILTPASSIMRASRTIQNKEGLHLPPSNVQEQKDIEEKAYYQWAIENKKRKEQEDFEENLGASYFR